MAFWDRTADGIEWLSNIEFFEGFSTDELARVQELSSEVEFQPGDVLIDQGDTGVDCFVIVDGSAAVYIGSTYIVSLSAGALAGEMALVDHRPRTASVIAETAMRALRFDLRQFGTLLSELPKAEERIMALLTARLRSNG